MCKTVVLAIVFALAPPAIAASPAKLAPAKLPPTRANPLRSDSARAAPAAPTPSKLGVIRSDPTPSQTIKSGTGPPIVLQSGRTPNTFDRVACILEVGGEVKAAEEGKITRSTISVEANLVYDERTLQWSAAPRGRRQSMRHYDRAEAVIKVGEEAIKPALRAQRCLVGVSLEEPAATLFSPQGTLARDELDLVDILGNSLLVDRLLPEKPVRQGESWSHADSLLAAMLGLDAVKTQDVKSTLAQVDATSATMEMGGRLEGAVGGVTTRIEIKAKYRYSFATKRIDWLGLLVREDRDIGHVARGVDVVARLRMQIQPIQTSEHLTDAALADLPRVPSEELLRLSFEPASGGWRFLHDRRWFVMGNEHDLGVLRFVDRGELVAQCNVAPLAPVLPGKQATLEQFQEDVRKALGKDFGQFVSAGQRANQKDYRELRVVVQGVVSGLPIRWYYYLVADEQGRQVAFTFTVEERLVERLGDADRKLLESFEFAGREVAMSPKASP